MKKYRCIKATIHYNIGDEAIFDFIPSHEYWEEIKEPEKKMVSDCHHAEFWKSYSKGLESFLEGDGEEVYKCKACYEICNLVVYSEPSQSDEEFINGSISEIV